MRLLALEGGTEYERWVPDVGAWRNMHIRERNRRKHSENVTDRVRKCEKWHKTLSLLWLTVSTLTLSVTKDGYLASTRCARMHKMYSSFSWY
jgi:hypothetical protein